MWFALHNILTPIGPVIRVKWSEFSRRYRLPYRAVLILVNGQVNESTVCPLQRTAFNTLRRFLCKKLTSLLCSVGEFEGFYRKPSNNHRTWSVCSMAKSMIVTRWDDARTEKAEVEPRYNVSRVYKFEPSTVYDRYCIYQSREKTPSGKSIRANER